MEQKRVISGVVEIDIHGMTKYQAKICLDNLLKKVNHGVYRIRVIHGFHSGTELKDMVRSNYRKHPKIIRIEMGLNAGISELVLREL
jgi:DNA-nicking Smr family endonuclease